MNATQDDGPWYRHPMMWLVIAPPTAAVIAGIVTMTLILQHPDPEVRVPHPGAAVIHGHGAGSLVPPAD